MTAPAVRHRLADAADRHEGVHQCVGFAWIGQAVTSCDRCGRPAWDHDYMEHPGAPFTNEPSTFEPWPGRIIRAWLHHGYIGQARSLYLHAVRRP